MIRNIKKYFLAAVMLATVTMTTACSSGSNRENAAFNTLVDQMEATILEGNSFTKHFVDSSTEKNEQTSSDLVLPSLSTKSQMRTCKLQKSYLKKLEAFEDDSLSDSQLHTKNVLVDSLKKQVALEPYRYYQNPFGSGSSVSTMTRDFVFYSFNNKQDIENYSLLLVQIPKVLEDAVAFEKERREQGIFLSNTQLQSYIDIAETLSKASDDKNIYITEFDKKVDKLSALTKSEKAAYKKNNKRMIHKTIQPAYKKFKKDLTKIQKATKKQNTQKKVRLAQFPEGKEYYELLLSQQAGSELTAEKSIQTLEKEVSSIQKSIKDSLKNNDDLSLDYMTALPALSTSRDVLSELMADTKIYYPEIENVDCKIKEMPSALSTDSSTAFYVLSALDKDATNTVYLNSIRIGSTELFPTVAHETYPGHLYQVNYALQKDFPLIRYLTTTKGYDEGWAMYAQISAYDYMEFQSVDSATRHNLQSLYRSKDILNIYLLSLSDLYVNYENYKKPQLIKKLKKYGIDKEQATTIYHYVIENPCTYLTYGIGYYEFEQLEKTAQKKLGNDFDLKSFRTKILDAGSCSFTILKNRIK